MFKERGELVIDWIWKCVIWALKSGVVPEDRISAIILPLCKGRGKNLIQELYIY